MIRNIVEIDEEKCNGCGLCAEACHESAIIITDGKAKLIRDDYCDGLGNCLPVCPTGAITIIQREADPYDEETVLKNIAARQAQGHSGCPEMTHKTPEYEEKPVDTPKLTSQLSHWPVQLKLVAPNAAFFKDADLMIAADCTAYAYADFHRDYINGHVVMIACPKLDDADYTGKLAEIFHNHSIRSVEVVRMEVGCCGGLDHFVKKAIALSGKELPVKTTIITIDGKVKEVRS